MDDSTISTGKAAKICGVTPDSVLKWIKKGKIVAIRTPGGHYRIKKETLTPYITEQKAPVGEINALSGGKISFCWEYHAKDGNIQTGCRNCMVFKVKAERCYLLAGKGKETGYEEINCAESCDKCIYYQHINKPIYNVLIISDNDDLKHVIVENISDLYILKFSCCGYETATVIQDFHPDYIVIDDSMDKSKTDEITSYLINDPRVHGAQIILAVDSKEAKKHLRDGICAYIDLPFDAKDIERCFYNLHINLLGLNN